MDKMELSGMHHLARRDELTHIVLYHVYNALWLATSLACIISES